MGTERGETERGGTERGGTERGGGGPERGIHFSKYFDWKDGIHCQKSILTKISQVRFLKICQI